jgi:hypothetical protein
MKRYSLKPHLLEKAWDESLHESSEPLGPIFRMKKHRRKNMRKKFWTFPILIVFLGLLVTACLESGTDIDHSESIPYDDLDSLKVSLDIGAGYLRIMEGAEGLLEGDFTYNVERWKPEIEYTPFDNRGIISVEQGRYRGAFGRSQNKWRIRLNDDIPLDLRIDFGAGEAELDLSSFQMQNLMIDMGVGDLELNLTGDYQNDFKVEIDGGIGSATLFLPGHIGIRADIDGGLGSIDTPGFYKRGNVYTNDAYDSSEVTIEIKVDAGIGSIALVQK